MLFEANVKMGMEIGTTKKRFFVLALFCLFSLTNSFQWIQYSIIDDIIKEFYEVSDFAVDFTSVIFMLVYIPLIFPATWCLDKKGLRFSLLLGAFGNFLGAAIKCFSLTRDRFWVAMIGQSCAAVSQVFVLNIPPILAAVWFPNEEVSRATAAGVFGNQLGVAAGFIIPTYLVGRASSQSTSDQLGYIVMGTAALTAFIFILILFYFEEKPQLPPSFAQIKGNTAQTSYASSLRTLFVNRNFVLLLICYGLNGGVLYAISTLLNQVIALEFPNNIQSAGDMGLIATLSGIVGATIGGIVLDKTHWYRAVTIVSYASCVLSVGALCGCIVLGILWPMYIGAFAFGFFMTGYLPIGFEFAAELTHPEPEGTSAGLLNASAQFFGILLTFGGSAFVGQLGNLWTMVAFTGVLSIGLLLTILTKADLRRLKAEAEGLNRPPSYVSFDNDDQTQLGYE